MKASPNRRDVLRALAAAPIGHLVSSIYTDGFQPSSGTSHRDFSKVRRRVLEAVANGKATGVGVAVAHRGQIVWEEGFGWADRARDVKVTAATPFCLASLTKTFTTTLLMALVADGKLSLNQPANRYPENVRIVGTSRRLLPQMERRSEGASCR